MPWDANAAEIKATAPQGLHQRASERALWVQAVSSGPPLGVGRLRTQLAALCLTGCRPQAPCFDWLPVVLSISREARGDKGRQPPPSAPAVLSAAATAAPPASVQPPSACTPGPAPGESPRVLGAPWARFPGLTRDRAQGRSVCAASRPRAMQGLFQDFSG